MLCCDFISPLLGKYILSKFRLHPSCEMPKVSEKYWTHKNANKAKELTKKISIRSHHKEMPSTKQYNRKDKGQAFHDVWSILETHLDTDTQQKGGTPQYFTFHPNWIECTNTVVRAILETHLDTDTTIIFRYGEHSWGRTLSPKEPTSRGENNRKNKNKNTASCVYVPKNIFLFDT